MMIFGVPRDWFIYSLVLWAPFGFFLSITESFLPFGAIVMFGYSVARHYDPFFAEILTAWMRSANYFFRIGLTSFPMPSMFDFLNPYLRGYKQLRLPFYAPAGDVMLFKDESLGLVYELNPIVYEGKEDSELEKVYSTLKVAVERSGGLQLSFYCMRQMVDASLNASFDGKEGLSGDLVQTWDESFTRNFRNRYYLALTKKAWAIGVKKEVLNPKIYAGIYRDLQEKSKILISVLERFKPSKLNAGEQVAFWEALANGRVARGARQRDDGDVVEAGILDSEIFSGGKLSACQKYSSDGRWFGFLTFANIETGFCYPQFFQTLSSLSFETIVTMHVRLDDAQKGKSIAADRLRTAEKFEKHGELVEAELLELSQGLQAGNIQTAKLCFFIQVQGESEEECESNLVELKKHFLVNNVVVKQDIIIKNALYLAQFPGLESYNPRSFRVTTENVSHMLAFSQSNQGLSSCSWGKQPTSYFSTTANDIYRFCFHGSEDDNAAGHTLVIGSTGTGKSVLSSFLMSCALRYQDMRILSFDQHRGLYTSTVMQEGGYTDFVSDKDAESRRINPFMFIDGGLNDGSNKIFLSGFFNELLGASSEDEIVVVSEALEQYFLLDIKKRQKMSLHDFQTMISPVKHGALHRRFNEWLGDGVSGGIFDASDTTLSLEKRLNVYDFTRLFGREKVLGLVASWIIHAFRGMAAGEPRMIFVDEFYKYYRSPVFRGLIREILQQARKANTVFMAALQDISHLTGEEGGEQELGNFAKFIIFPGSNSWDERIYREVLGLTEADMTWLKTTPPANREVLVLNKGGESVRLRVDLQNLGEYLRIYDSNAGTVKMVAEKAKELSGNIAGLQDWFFGVEERV